MGRFDFAESKGGLWDDGWYPAVVVESYEAGANNTVFRTEDSVSQRGDSRNLQICFGVVKTDRSGGFTTTDTRHIRYNVNYVPSDLDPARIAQVQKYSQDHKGQQVRDWPEEDRDIKRAFLTYSRLHEIDRLLGKELPMNGSGFDPEVLIKMEADVRIYTDENNGKKFNSISNVAPRGSKVKEPKERAKGA
jgi:hypothetical protein